MGQQYYMTSKSNSIVRDWEPCKAQTLRGAKAECSRRFGGGYHDEVLCVGVEEYPGQGSTIVSISRRGQLDASWTETQ